MTFPTRTAGTPYNASNNTTTNHVIDLPDSPGVGDILVVPLAINIINVTGAPTTFPAGWTKLVNDVKQAAADANVQLTVGMKRLSPGDPELTNPTMTVATLDPVRVAGVAYKYTGVHASSMPEAATAAGNSSPDPPSLTPSWGARDTAWLAVCSVKNTTDITGFPTNYTPVDEQVSGTSVATRATLGTADRNLNATSDDPSAFTIVATPRLWVAGTIAIRPAGNTVTATMAAPGGGQATIGARIEVNATLAAAGGGTAHIGADIEAEGTLTAAGGGQAGLLATVRHQAALAAPGDDTATLRGSVRVHASMASPGGGTFTLDATVNGQALARPPGRVTAVDATFNMAERLLDCVGAQLAGTTQGAPSRAFVATGAEIAWDDCHCGQLTVHMLRTYPSDNFPLLKQAGPFNRCEAKLSVVEYVITILRCVPVQDNRGNPPAPGRMTDAARLDHEDRRAVRAGVACCFDDEDPRKPGFRLVQEQLAVGDQGMCAGSELHVFIGFPNCAPCADES